MGRERDVALGSRFSGLPPLPLGYLNVWVHIPLLTGFLFLLKWPLEQHTLPIYVSNPQASLPFKQKLGS